MNTHSDKRNLYRSILLFIALMAVGICGNYFLENTHYGHGYHRKLQKQMNHKYKELDTYYTLLKDNGWNLKKDIPSDKGIIFIAYLKDTLVYWSDNNIQISTFNKLAPGEAGRFAFISNGWYVIKEYADTSFRAYGLYKVKNEYPYENDFLTNNFQEDLKIPSSTTIYNVVTEGAYSINDWEGMYLFSVKFDPDELRYSGLVSYYIPVVFFILIFAVMFFLNSLIPFIRGNFNRNMVPAFIAIFFAGFRFIQYRYNFPERLYEIPLFGPVPFGYSVILSSLGDVLVNAILLLYLAYRFNRDFKLKAGTGTRNYFLSFLFVVGYACLFVYTHYVLSNLVYHSTINYEIYNVANLNVYTLLSLLIIAMHFTVLLLFMDRTLRLCKQTCDFASLIIMMLSLTAFIIIMTFITGYRIDVYSFLAFIGMFLLLSFWHYRNFPMYNYTSLVLVLILFSLYSIFFINHYAGMKTRQNMEVLAEKLSEQHDPVAEYMLEDIYYRMIKDSGFFSLLNNRKVSYEEIKNHLTKNYFSGYWTRYNISMTDCLPEDMILPQRINMSYNCQDYYNDIIANGGTQLGNTEFYFLDIMDGRIHYMGRFSYTNPETNTQGMFFLEIVSVLVTEELGYPELLLDKNYLEAELYKDYSYAKYYRNQLLASSGEYRYSLNYSTYSFRKTFSRFDGYDHFTYLAGNDNVIIISKLSVSFLDQLFSFSYIFLFFYILALALIGIRYFIKFGTTVAFNFVSKIRLAVISILLLSLLFVGGGTILLSIEQYRDQQYNNLSEKVKSVYLELDKVLATAKGLSENWQGYGYENLNQFLISLSEVFFTDINLFDTSGKMIGTSRAEIFNEGIIGKTMDPVAYNEIALEKQSEYIHNENIGKLKFLSAYIPFVNTEKKLLVYVNLPYFSKENELSNEMTNLIVAVLNIYVLLVLLTFMLTVFISDQIVSPLKLIQKKFSEIKLGKKNEEIVYRGRDEIAGLVDEYNRMVKELARSVELLSKSERESAWREMAKQIAHEIKNPLTPMKLSIQHLHKTWKEDREHFDEYMSSFTKTLIEQIDNLSFIASEFSNFAKMPRATSIRINLADVIKSSISLFSDTDDMNFFFRPHSENIPVFADRDQLSRAFINLIKNAIQAIPENQTGIIDIETRPLRGKVLVTLSDNGKGIPPELIGKLFTPSFTTKSSGMGLGLTITKNIIESFHGNITFKTEVNAGTTFFIELPVMAK